MGFAAFLSGPSQASAASSTESFAVLAGTAVSCTDSTITGDVGIYPGIAFSPVNCTVNGTIHKNDAVAKKAFKAFLAEYARVAALPCTQSFSVATLGDTTFTPGVICFDAALTVTNATFTLDGSSNDTWIFKIGTGGTGALTGTNFSVLFTGEGTPCNVTWWVAEAATLTAFDTEQSHPFVGTILAGMAITTTGNQTFPLAFTGDAFAKAAVTLTDTNLVGCEASAAAHKAKCNQGVGNGPEDCDPGNSNQGDPGNSNDELGGTPGNPGKGP